MGLVSKNNEGLWSEKLVFLGGRNRKTEYGNQVAFRERETEELTD